MQIQIVADRYIEQKHAIIISCLNLSKGKRRNFTSLATLNQ